MGNMRYKKWLFSWTVLLAGFLALAVSVSAAALGTYGMLPVYGRDVRDGNYAIAVESLSERFRVEEARLTAADGALTAELTLSGTDCIGLFLGTAEAAAQADVPEWIVTTETITGTTSCTLPVEALDRAMDCAFYSMEEDAWLDNQLLFDASGLPEEALLVELPDYELIERALERLTEEQTGENAAVPVEAVTVDLADGEYAVSVDLTGGSGKATVVTPTVMTVRDGKAYATIEWSSANYDYMVVGTKTYYNTSLPEANSVFEIPIGCWDREMPVIADTTAMGTPHEIPYTLTFYESSIAGKGSLPRKAAKRVVGVALVIIVGGGILNYCVKKRRT